MWPRPIGGEALALAQLVGGDVAHNVKRRLEGLILPLEDTVGKDLVALDLAHHILDPIPSSLVHCVEAQLSPSELRRCSRRPAAATAVAATAAAGAAHSTPAATSVATASRLLEFGDEPCSADVA